MVRATFTGSLVVGLLIVLPLLMMLALIVAWTLQATFLLSIILISMSVFFVIQGVFAIRWMLYGWSSKRELARHAPPEHRIEPKRSFTALVPARHESAVIADTIKAIGEMNYPERLCETLILCRSDDAETIKAARKAIRTQKLSNARVVTFRNGPITKPAALNVGLRKAKNEVVVVFDAEDEPHRELYDVVNTVMEGGARIVQSGVQLMNHRSRWFSAFNVLEYYFWFNSALHYFKNIGVVPLGGNTVFFDREMLLEIGGWDETCLTEDADIGIRLSARGERIEIIYDPRIVTREETPPTARSFIKQRTRWNQGFLQILGSGSWRSFPALGQLFSIYILGWPIVQAMLIPYLIIAAIIALSTELPALVALIAFVPLFILVLQLVIYVIGLRAFTKDYGLSYPLYLPFFFILTFIPFYLLLAAGASRASWRYMTDSSGWEKTEHIGAHRVMRRA